jgi:hypothetical protein
MEEYVLRNPLKLMEYLHRRGIFILLCPRYLGKSRAKLKKQG